MGHGLSRLHTRSCSDHRAHDVAQWRCVASCTRGLLHARHLSATRASRRRKPLSGERISSSRRSDAVVIVDATLGVTDGRCTACAGRRARQADRGRRRHPRAPRSLRRRHRLSSTGSMFRSWPLRRSRRGHPRATTRARSTILRPMFGAEWPQRRTFPNRTVQTARLRNSSAGSAGTRTRALAYQAPRVAGVVHGTES